MQRYAHLPRHRIPIEYLDPDPQNHREVDIAMAIIIAQEIPTAGPVYDDDDVLIGWRGLRIRPDA